MERFQFSHWIIHDFFIYGLKNRRIIEKKILKGILIKPLKIKELSHVLIWYID
jgi:hypothetical protein